MCIRDRSRPVLNITRADTKREFVENSREKLVQLGGRRSELPGGISAFAVERSNLLASERPSRRLSVSVCVCVCVSSLREIDSQFAFDTSAMIS